MANRGRWLGLLLLAAAIVLAGCSAGAGSSPTPTSGPAQDVRHGDPNRNVVALTFDAGYPGLDAAATATYTEQILDALKTREVKASFAMTGVFAEAYPYLLLRIVKDGHLLMNHTYNHWHFVHGQVFPPQHGLTQAQRWDEIDTTEKLVKEITGVSTKPFFRPPYGDYDASVDADIAADGYRYNVLWTVDSRGWQSVPPDQIIPNVLAQAQPGSIILFHLGVQQDSAALPAIIDGLRNMGYGFATVAEMIAAGGTGP